MTALITLFIPVAQSSDGGGGNVSQNPRVRLSAGGHVPMVGWQCGFEDAQSAVEQCGGGCEFALLLAEHGQVIQRGRDLGVVRAQRRLLDSHRPTVVFVRLRVVAPFLGNRPKIVQADGALIMVRSEPALEDIQCSSVECLGLVMPPLACEKSGQRRNVGGDVRIIRPQDTLTQLDSASRIGLTFRESASGMLQPAQVVIHAGQRTWIWIMVTPAGRPRTSRCGSR